MHQRDREFGRAFARRLARAMKRAGVNANSLGLMIERPPATIRSVLAGGVPNIGLAIDLADGLGVSLESLISNQKTQAAGSAAAATGC